MPITAVIQDKETGTPAEKQQTTFYDAKDFLFNSKLERKIDVKITSQCEKHLEANKQHLVRTVEVRFHTPPNSLNIVQPF